MRTTLTSSRAASDTKIAIATRKWTVVRWRVDAHIGACLSSPVVFEREESNQPNRPNLLNQQLQQQTEAPTA
jgi:hypothetical protein